MQRGPIIRALTRLLGSLPLSAARFLGRGLGALVYRSNIDLVRTTRENLASCYPELDDRARERLTFASVCETLVVACETCVVFTRDFDQLKKKIVAVHGRELLERARSGSKGTIFMSPHIGNWEFLGLYLAGEIDLVTLYHPPKMKELETIIREHRARSGATLAATDRKGLSALIKQLESGGAVGILPDQSPKDWRSGAFAPFFNKTAFTLNLIHRLLLRTGSEAIFCCALRVPRGFELFFFETSEKLSDADEKVSLTALNHEIEKIVRLAPEQYQWEYKRFRRRPEQRQASMKIEDGVQRAEQTQRDNL